MSSVRCDLCNVHLSSHAVLDAHNSGKKHRKKVQDTEHFSALTSRSVYVSGLPLNTFTSIKQVSLMVKKWLFCYICSNWEDDLFLKINYLGSVDFKNLNRISNLSIVFVTST